MLFQEFDDLIKRVFLFMGSDVPTDAQKREWFEDVKRIPTGAIRGIWDNLKQRDAISRRTNVPKIVNEIYAKISTAGGSDRAPVVDYDPVEDFRFPVYAETFIVPAAAKSYRLVSPTGEDVMVVKTFVKPVSQWVPGVMAE